MLELLLQLFFCLIVWVSQFFNCLKLPHYLQLASIVQAAQPTPTSDLSAAPNPPESQLVFADNFNHQFNRWQLVQGSWNDWQIVDGQAQAYLEPHYYTSVLIPKEEHWNASWQHYLYQFDFKVSQGRDKNWSWGYEDNDNWYEIHFSGKEWHLVRVDDGWQRFNRFGRYQLERDKVYQVQIEFNQGKIKFWIDDELIYQANDHSYEDNSGPISLKATTGLAAPTKVSFDNVRVWLMEPEADFKLSMTSYKQSDERWSLEEYDSAKRWSEDPPTIRRWGCAMTSLAMILNYYDYSQLPDGSELNPLTLNDWLNHQPDGYIGHGHLNWLAGVRLSAVLSEQLSVIGRQFPKLEFYRISLPQQSYIISALKKRRPIILQIPGHFLIANGFTQNEEDLYILDPAYIYSRLSQHQEPQVFSAIDYRPSQTDLSNIMVVYPEAWTVSILDGQGNLVESSLLAQDTWQSFESENDGLTGLLHLAPQPSELNSAPVTQFVSQPASGEYQLQIEKPQRADLLGQDLEIYLYDQQGNLKKITQVLPLNNGSTAEFQLSLDFDKIQAKSSMVQLEPLIDFNYLAQILSQPFDSSLIYKHYLYLKLQQFFAYWHQALANEPVNQAQISSRYQQLILRFIQAYQPDFSDIFLAEIAVNN